MALGTCNIQTKKTRWWVEFLVIVFFFCSSVVSPKGTLEQKNMMMKSWALRCSSHGDPHHLNKKNTMTRNRTSRHCVPRTCNIKTKKNMTTRSRTPHHCAFEWLATLEQKKYDEKELNSLSSSLWGPGALKQKKTWWWGGEFVIIVCSNDLQHYNKKARWEGTELLVIMSFGPTTL